MDNHKATHSLFEGTYDQFRNENVRSPNHFILRSVVPLERHFLLLGLALLRATDSHLLRIRP
jgi:hypothetical protein